MQIVIDIPEELKNKIDNANEDNYKTYLWWFETTLYCAIKNGTPLPKGHGRLIDADALEFRNVTVSYGYDWECGESTYAEEEVIRADDIWNASTIIEADKESEE